MKHTLSCFPIRVHMSDFIETLETLICNSSKFSPVDIVVYTSERRRLAKSLGTWLTKEGSPNLVQVNDYTCRTTTFSVSFVYQKSTTREMACDAIIVASDPEPDFSSHLKAAIDSGLKVVFLKGVMKYKHV